MLFRSHTSHLTPHTSHLTPHTSHLTPHTSHLTPHTSQVKRVPWALSMLRTKHTTFGNLSGYSAAGVDMNNLASWISSQVPSRVPLLQLPTTPSPSTFTPKPCLNPLQFDDTLTWADIEWVKSVWQGPLVVKGIMSKDDAVGGA